MQATTDRGAETKEQKIRRLQSEFIESALSEVATLRGQLEASSGTFHGSVEGERLRKIAHDLRGCGAAYGFMALGEVAGRLEDSYWSNEPTDVLQGLAAQLEEAIGRAKAALEQTMAATAG